MDTYTHALLSGNKRLILEMAAKIKREAGIAILSGKSVANVARDLGISRDEAIDLARSIVVAHPKFIAGELLDLMREPNIGVVKALRAVYCRLTRNDVRENANLPPYETLTIDPATRKEGSG